MPWNCPNSWATDNSPVLSNARTLLARSVAPTVNSVDVIVFVLDSLIDLSASSWISCTNDTDLSNAPSTVSALKGSFSTKSNSWVCVVERLITNVSLDKGATTIVTFPPPASPAPLTV